MEALRDFIRGPKPFKFSRHKWAYMRIAIAIAGTCGLRAGEVCGLRWDRIDPDTGEINVDDVVTGHLQVCVRSYPKTEAGFRKVPTTPSLRSLLNDYADSYKKHFGKCVGHVVRTERAGTKYDFIERNLISFHFGELMRSAGLVKPDGTPKFSFHALRHWCGAHWTKSTADIHLVAKWMGHAQASTTLNSYGHYLDDGEGRARFERMPDWLDQPIMIEDRPLAKAPTPMLSAPLAVSEDTNGSSKTAVVPISWFNPVPDDAARWVEPFLAELRAQGRVDNALRAVGKTRRQAGREFMRLDWPSIEEL
jgi:hypothetical protein